MLGAMVPSAPPAVSALVYSILRERCGDGGGGVPFVHNQVVRFVLEQQGRMPDFLRFGLRLLTLTLDKWTLPLTGRAFHRLPHDRRWSQIEAWRKSGLRPVRDAVRFYESLSIFAWHAYVHDDAAR
jgi:hypothetical protein